MFDIGFSELVLIGVLGLLILGPERLPQAAKSVGLWVRKIRNIAKNLSSEIERELEVEDLRKELANKNETIMKQADSLSKKLNKPVEEIFSFDEKPHDPNEEAAEKIANQPAEKSITPKKKKKKSAPKKVKKSGDKDHE
ncbi:MAG TPA: twin-arginine translocase subunit TatB [Aeromonadales bacterium]|nr:twin-arginine translocase subunit TatB [Aeromonadales bacterium]